MELEGYFIRYVDVMANSSDEDFLHLRSLTLVIADGSEIQEETQSLVARNGIFGTVCSTWVGTYEMKIGAITFQVATGDITKERADVIVNSTTRTFNLKSGVSKAILEGAGPAVENECAVRAAQGHQDFIVTRGGHLMCRRIIHVIGDNNVRKTVYDVLQECKKRQYASVCLPAIGTGNAGKNPATVADDTINGVGDFVGKHSTGSLKIVKVVILLPHLLNVFYNSMKKRESLMSPTFQFTFSGTASDVPEHWSDMNQQQPCLVQLQPRLSEYKTVMGKFNQTCHSYTIEKIERVQNTLLWKSYQLKKSHMDAKNGHIINEKLLFHGTDAGSVPHINQHGFNRSYAGKNAAAYGKGTYFAVDACYSANDAFSKPDENGRKHMYVVRVLTGLYARGHAGLLAPPAKNPENPTELYDSVTDDKHHPQIFVVFSDDHAYPEYLITFRC
ncbi:poly [ADP-ribose] polymerase 15 isoform X2 [Trichechus manatus latirostris]|uniref:Poly [ADP-ribose] polymerase n=1 Tax=Trichechus manatus latirostris TaxID=127582 RepID=A0A2Y9QZ09_TRIMA|nr:poly [ADP-ribose] polymerase 15 isoform X2 [Trichechus manatus latirostris]